MSTAEYFFGANYITRSCSANEKTHNLSDEFSEPADRNGQDPMRLARVARPVPVVLFRWRNFPDALGSSGDRLDRTSGILPMSSGHMRPMRPIF
jgi:hypothetical protein